MEIVLCFASYEEKNGMYYNTKIFVENFSKDDIIEEVENYYKSIGIEEFLLADTWTDDNDNINEIILKNYSENFYTFVNFLEELQENISELENIDSILYNYINDNLHSGKGSISDIIQSISDYTSKYDNIDDIFSELWEQDGNNIDSEFKSLFYWLSSDDRIRFLNNNMSCDIIEGEKCFYTIRQ